MHPLSTAFFLLGYALALPIAGRLPSIIVRQQRLAMWGHQFGVVLAGVGWLLRGQALVALLHGLWLAIAYVWFELTGKRAAKEASTA